MHWFRLRASSKSSRLEAAQWSIWFPPPYSVASLSMHVPAHNYWERNKAHPDTHLTAQAAHTSSKNPQRAPRTQARNTTSREKPTNVTRQKGAHTPFSWVWVCIARTSIYYLWIHYTIYSVQIRHRHTHTHTPVHELVVFIQTNALTVKCMPASRAHITLPHKCIPPLIWCTSVQYSIHAIGLCV